MHEDDRLARPAHLVINREAVGIKEGSLRGYEDRANRQDDDGGKPGETSHGGSSSCSAVAEAMIS